MRKMVLLRWSVGAVGAGSVPGGAVGGARFGVVQSTILSKFYRPLFLKGLR